MGLINKASDINDEDVLNYLADKQGTWTSLWYGYFKDRHPREDFTDVWYAMPPGTPNKVALAKMRRL